MDGPEVLVSHYASLAFYTRIAALTFAGAMVGAMNEHLKQDDVRLVVGSGVLLVVAALAEFNRRYTFAYAAAVHAACHVVSTSDEGSIAASARWCRFRDLNGLTDERTLQRRMLLSWITYIPGLALGGYLLWQVPLWAIISTSLALAWMVRLALRPYPAAGANGHSDSCV